MKSNKYKRLIAKEVIWLFSYFGIILFSLLIMFLYSSIQGTMAISERDKAKDLLKTAGLDYPNFNKLREEIDIPYCIRLNIFLRERSHDHPNIEIVSDSILCFSKYLDSTYVRSIYNEFNRGKYKFEEFRDLLKSTNAENYKKIKKVDKLEEEYDNLMNLHREYHYSKFDEDEYWGYGRFIAILFFVLLYPIRLSLNAIRWAIQTLNKTTE